MPRQIHSVMQNANDFDHLGRCCTAHDEMSPAPPVAGDMEGAQAPFRRERSTRRLSKPRRF